MEAQNALSDSISTLKREISELKRDVAEMKKKMQELPLKTTEQDTKSDSFDYQLAQEVTAIVGLREAITSKHPAIRVVWICLLCAGIGATIYEMYEIGTEYVRDPSATIVKLDEKPEYAFPPLVLCPDGWLDADKALSLGLTMDGLIYSLGYIYDEMALEDPIKGREDFLRFYHAHGYTSLVDYLKDLTVDPVVLDSPLDFANASDAFYFCKGCTNSNVTKVFVELGLCYRIQLKNAHPHYLPMSNLRRVVIGLEDRTRNLISVSNRWTLHICSTFTFLNPQCRSISIRTSFMSMVQVGVTSFSKLNTLSSPCLEDAVHLEYAPDECWCRCENQHHKRLASCAVFWYAPAKGKQNLADFCNYFDYVQNNQSLLEYFGSPAALNYSEDDFACFQKCRYPCSRIAYQLKLEAEYGLLETNVWDLRSVLSQRRNLSLVFIQVTHSAAFDGGTTDITEIQTFSASQLVGHIGGTLGLFVGGTVLTLAQLILFWVNYFCYKREKRSQGKS